MSFSNLPNTFLKLPEMGNINKFPNDPYDLGTIGMIHSSKFMEICRVFFDNNKDLKEQLAEIVTGHRLEGVIENLETDELADFIRHVAVANKERVGWEFIDEVNYKLKRNYTPRWELPSLEFDKGFREIFLTRVPWEPSSSTRELLPELLETYQKKTGNKLNISESLNFKTAKVWNFKDLFILLNELSYLVDEFRGEIDADKYSQLYNALKQLFQESYRNRIFTVEQRISMIFLYIKGVLQSGLVDFSEIQILLDNSYSMIKQLDDDQQKSFRLMFSYLYAIFAYYLFTSTSDLVIQRDIIAELVQDFYQPEDVDLSYWSKHLATSKPHPIVMSLIVGGYYQIIQMVLEYVKALPLSETRTELMEIHDKLNEFLEDILKRYLELYYGIDINLKPDLLHEIVNDKVYFVNFKRVLLESLFHIKKNNLLKTPKSAITDEKIDEFFNFAKVLYNEELAHMHVLDIKVRKLIYDFEDIRQTILEEFEEKNSIILSTTFEDEVINVVGKIFSEIQNKFKTKEEIDIENYEIILLFVTTWMQYCSQYDDLRYESLMILTPIASICYIQLARGYFEKNNLEAAYLNYFNSHFLLEMINEDLALHSSMQEASMSKLVKKFTSLVDEWNIGDLLDNEYIKKISSSIELKITDRLTQRANKSFSMGGMLKDEIVIGYLDLITKLETFLQLSKGEGNVRLLINESGIFDQPYLKSVFRHDLLGYLRGEPEKEWFPFPIIRNTRAYSMAIKLYPIDVNLPGSIMDISKLFGSSN